MDARAGLAAALAVSAVCAAPSARAFEADLPGLGQTSLDFTNTLLVRVVDEAFGTSRSDDRILTLLNKMNAIVTRDPVTFGVRFDMAYFPLDDCSWLRDGSCPRRDYTQVEKIFATWTHEYGSITGGDFYASFGEGITLNVRKADELGLDTTIRGGKADVRVGPWRFEALGGLVNAHNLNLAQAQDIWLRDPNDLVIGAQTGLYLDSGFEVQVRGVHYWYDRPSTLGREERAGVVGATLAMHDLGPASFLVEGAIMRHLDQSQSTGETIARNGEALYARLNAQFGALSTMLEFKYYNTFDLAPPDPALRNAFIRYHQPPSLERIDQLVPTFTDATGMRLLVEYFFRSTYTRVYANVVGYTYADGLGGDQFGEGGNWILHGYAGIAQRFGPVSLELSGGYREDRDNGRGDINRTLWHGEVEVNASLGGAHALAFKWWHRSERKNLIFSVKDFELGLASLTYSFSPGIRVSALYGYNTEFDQRDPIHYPAGQLDWDYWQASSLRIFAGMVPGGIVCAGGTCVQVPASRIYSAQIVTRF